MLSRIGPARKEQHGLVSDRRQREAHDRRVTAMAQGANDPIVPPAESQQLVDMLRARGRTVQTGLTNHGATFESF